MKRMTILLLAVASLAAAGCSQNKELLAQKDTEISDLQSNLSQLKQQMAEQKQMTDDLNQQLADLKDQNRVLVQQKEDLTFITLDGSATFATARADLSTGGKQTIDRVWSVLQNYPDRPILIEGYTDSRAIRPSFRHVYASNWELSTARANAVLHYIQKQYNVADERLAAVGRGANAPVADNATPEGRAQNRRVVITVGSKAAMEAHMKESPVTSSR
jgi:chemotaxis protein MotB